VDWKDLSLVIGGMIAALIEAVRIALGYTQDLRNGRTRILFLVGIFFWAISYDTFRTDERFKKMCGGFEILISAILIWFQLAKIGEFGWQEGKITDHCAILLGCVAFMSKGMKDWFVDIDKQYQ
jgi:hypothetical protein